MIMNRRNLVLLLIVAILFGPAVAQECTLPSAMDVETLVESLAISKGGEGQGAEITLLDHHFTCLAVGSRADRYREVSVAVRYNATQSGTTNMRLSQIQLECSGGTSTHFTGSGDPFEADPPESVLTVTTRRDCRLCVITAPSPIVVNADTNCALCGASCLGTGQGGCSNVLGTSCCPFFASDSPHSCVMSCAANMTGVANNNYICGCSPGYSKVGGSCVHICDTNDPCQNGGTCNIDADSYICTCPSLWTGQNCTDDRCLAQDLCENGGTCLRTNSSFICQCSSESYFGTTCSNINQCELSNPCINGGTCTNTTTTGGYVCQCPSGYHGTTCSKINRCELNNPCFNGGTCMNTTNTNGFVCHCPTGYTGMTCQSRMNTCSTTSETCLNGGTCTNRDGGYSCLCVTGFMGEQCAEIDYCNPNPCQNGGTCMLQSNRYSCTCTTGYTGQNCENCMVGFHLDGTVCLPRPAETNNAPLIIGIVFGILLALLLAILIVVMIIVVAIVLYKKRKAKPKHTMLHQDIMSSSGANENPMYVPPEDLENLT